jgi:hypothetical protein
MGDGATNQGTFGETMNLAALWKLPVVFLVINNQFGMGTALERHSAVTDLSQKSEGFGVPGSQCDGMDVLDTHSVVTDALKCAREQRKPQLVEAVTYRYRGHSMADPEEYRSKEEVEEWRERDPIKAFADRLVDEKVLTAEDVERFDQEATQLVDDAVKFADESPFPDLDSLYDDIYVFDSDVPAWWTVDERSPEVHRGEREREAGEVPHQLAEAGAAYAGVERRKRTRDGDDEGDGEPHEEAEAQPEGDGEEAEEQPEAEGEEAQEQPEGEGEEAEEQPEAECDEQPEGEAADGEGEPGADDAEERGGAG